MKITLTVLDRLMFNSIYPDSGSMLSMTMVEDLKTKLKIGTEEAESIELREEKVQVSGNTASVFKWNKEKDTSVEFEITGAEASFLKEQVDLLDKNKKITPEILTICKKIKGIDESKEPSKE